MIITKVSFNKFNSSVWLIVDEFHANNFILRWSLREKSVWINFLRKKHQCFSIQLIFGHIFLHFCPGVMVYTTKFTNWTKTDWKIFSNFVFIWSYLWIGEFMNGMFRFAHRNFNNMLAQFMSMNVSPHLLNLLVMCLCADEAQARK